MIWILILVALWLAVMACAFGQVLRARPYDSLDAIRELGQVLAPIALLYTVVCLGAGAFGDQAWVVLLAMPGALFAIVLYPNYNEWQWDRENPFSRDDRDDR